MHIDILYNIIIILYYTHILFKNKLLISNRILKYNKLSFISTDFTKSNLLPKN